MIKKLFYIAIISLTLELLSPAMVWAEQSSSSKYAVQLDKSERESRCIAIKNSKIDIPEDAHSISGQGIVPDAVLQGIYKTTYDISNTVARIMVLGQALTCHAVHAAKNKVEIMGITLVTYPNIPIWICGAIIYFIGFMLTLSVTFYLVDIGFKLGFAVIALPIGIALYPFSWTKDKLSKIISIILNSAAIFAFLSLCISYVYQLVNSALDGTDALFAQISENKVEEVSEQISLTSSTYILCLIALIYGMKLVGSAVKDYADKFFADGVFAGASPIHGSLTQAMDFAKQKLVDPVASYAKDVAKTQAGHVMKGTGKLITGQYNQQIKNAVKKTGHYIANPGEALDDGISAAGKGLANLHAKGASFVNSAVIDTVGRLALNEKARTELKNKLNAKAQQVSQNINSKVAGIGASINAEVSKVTDKHKAALRKLGNNISESKLGKTVAASTSKLERAVSPLANKARMQANAINKRYRNMLASTKKLNRRIRDFSTRMTKPINNAKKWVNNNITKAENAGLKAFSALSSLSKTVRTKLHTSINKNVQNKAARWLLNRTVDTLALTNIVTKPAAFIGKRATLALGGTLKGTTTALAAVAKAPIALPLLAARAVPKAAEIALKVVNIKKVLKKTVKITGGVMINVGDKMTRNKKSAAQIRAEERERQERRAKEDLEKEKEEARKDAELYR